MRSRPVRSAARNLIVPAALLATLGCGIESGVKSQVNEVQTKAAFAAPSSEAFARTESGVAALADKSKSGAGTEAKGGAGSEVPPAASRKIIYNAQVTLVVESLNGFDEKFTTLVKESGGYVSQTDQTTYAESQRHAVWTVRIPVDRFDSFLTTVGRLGELQQSHVDSQDVTMEYYDLEARIANKQQEEKRLLKHLADSTAELTDILAVEREISRVRGEVEQMQGRIRYLGNLSALSTVTVNVTEIKNYVPPVHPTFAGQIVRTFRESLELLVDFGKATVLFVVAVAPWLPLVILAALLVRWGLRRVFRRLASLWGVMNREWDRRFNRQGPVDLTRTGP